MKIHSDLLYGTAWKEADTERCVREALAAGFRAIDTANQRKHYFEQGVGDAIHAEIESGTVTRADLFLQTKFTFLPGQDERLPYDKKADIATQVHQSFESSLQHLRTDRIDSLILHGPSHRVGLGDADWQAWKAMEEIARAGKVGAIGVSNVGFDQLQELHNKADIKPSYMQNRCYAVTNWDRAIREFCQEHGVIYQGFSLLTANAQVFRQPIVKRLVQHYRTTPAQLIFRFAKQIGMWPLTGTTNPDHMREDLQSFSEPLTEADLRDLERSFAGAA
jgi:diketogulonate reductase-like aldo/keto reductase